MSESWGQFFLLATLLLPAIGALLLAFIPPRLAKSFALSISAFTLITVITLLWTRSHATNNSSQPTLWRDIDIPWISQFDTHFHVGIDGLSWPLLALTALLVLCAVMWLPSNSSRLPILLALIFALQIGVNLVFLALDLLVFFIAFELTLLPMYALIAGWGSTNRLFAAKKFVLYTVFGSVLLLAGVLVVATAAGSTDIVTLTANGGANIAHGIQVLAFVLLLVAFAVKSPLWPLHTWLPDAHTEAPTVGSVLLAGVMLKMGTYGLLRIALPVVPEGAKLLAPIVAGFAAAAIIAAALVCLAQPELKRLIAYSSVGHMGFVLLGIAAGNEIGLQAAVIANISHGLITGMLFFLVGAVKDRYGTGELAKLGGLRYSSPRLAALLGFAAVASFGLPGLAGFWGEFFTLVGTWQHASGWWQVLTVAAAVGAALTVAYFLRTLRRVVAVPKSNALTDVTPLHPRQVLVFSPLAGLILLLGVWPGWLLELTAEPVAQIARTVAG